MVETIKEFKDEVKMIRTEMYKKGEYADAKLVASWLDRLLISLEKIAPKLDLMMIELEELNRAVSTAPSRKKKKKAGIKKKFKKAAKKIKEKLKSKKKRRR
jgi:hypothetical protein